MSNKKNASIKRGNKINSSIEEEEENEIAGLTRLLAKKTSNSSQH